METLLVYDHLIGDRFGGLLFCLELFSLQEFKSTSQEAMQGGDSACAASGVLHMQGYGVAFS